MTSKTLFSATALALGALTVAATPASEPGAAVWNVDAPHSHVFFSVKHFFTPVRGQFDTFEVNLTYDRERPENSTVSVRIPVSSVNTGNERRDQHLVSGDFFEAEAHPYITFTTESVRKVGENELMVRGPLSIKGQTRTVELPVTILGVMDVPADMQEMLGGVTEIASFQTTLSLDRRDFGVGVGSWAATMVVGGEVNIDIAVEANR